MAGEWEAEGVKGVPRVSTKPLLPPSPETLWRPKPMVSPAKGFTYRDVTGEGFAGYSSFVPSESLPCDSTAPSENFLASPESAPADIPQQDSPRGQTTSPAACGGNEAVVVHQLSPAVSSECNEVEAPASLWLPPVASENSNPRGSSTEMSPLVQYLRRAKTLRMSLAQTMELQQQSLHLLLLHPRVAPPSLDSPCCWCSAAADPQQPQQQQQSCVVLLQIEMLQELLQQSSSQLQQEQEDMHKGDTWLYEEQQKEQQHQEAISLLLPQWQPQQQSQAVAAAAAELRIRRSVLKHHYQQLEEALSLQQRLQQEVRARWLVEAADEIRTSYPEASDVDVVKLLRPEQGADLWGCGLSDGLIGIQLREKREKLLRLEESLRQLQRMTTLLQQQQQGRQQQQQQVAAVLARTEQLTAAACTDLLVAQKHRRQSIKHTLMAGAAVILLFLFFVLPHTSLGSFLAKASD
ncbi:hypothetical protein Esti_001508 [Eimeria stiedai]